MNTNDIVTNGMGPELTGTTHQHGGRPVASENVSITAGPQGATVLNDIHLVEKLAHG